MNREKDAIARFWTHVNNRTATEHSGTFPFSSRSKYLFVCIGFNSIV